MLEKTRSAVLYFANRRKETQWNIYATHACFYALVSSIPLLMLVLMTVNFLMPARVEIFLAAVKDRLPPQVSSYFPEEFVRNAMSAGPTMAIATVFVLLWSMSKCMRAIAQGLQSIYGEAEPKNAVKSYFLPFLYAFVFFLMILLSLVVLVFGETILQFFESQQSIHRHWIRVIVRLGWLIGFLLFVLVFTMCYRFLGGTKYKLYRHLPGAFFAATGWLLYSALFSLYLRLFSPERYLVYGSLGAVLILMLWAHACMTILMLGGEINVLLLDRPALIKGDAPAGRAARENALPPDKPEGN